MTKKSKKKETQPQACDAPINENCEKQTECKEDVENGACETACSEEECASETMAEQGEESCDREARIAELEKELAVSQDRLLRLTAEFDNYRKRTIKEKGELIAQASSGTLGALLPVVDDFDRALANAETTDSLPALLEGLQIIHKSLLNFLQKEGVTEIESLGLALDTDFHDAVAKTPAPEKKQVGKIVDVVKKGYLLNGTVLRHAQVVIGE